MGRYVRSFILFGVILLYGTAHSSVPPHSKLKKLIYEGKVQKPYFLQHFKELHDQDLNMPWRGVLAKQGIRLPRKPLSTQGVQSNQSTTTTQYRALLILVKFSDKNSSVAPTSFDNLAFSTNPNTVRNYFNNLGYNSLMGDTLDIVTVNLPSTLGWMQAPQTYSYYVNGQNGFGSYPNNAQKLAEDAVTAVDGVVNFSNYDNDSDGFVDALMIAHAGSGAEFTGSDYDIWSHSWEMSSPKSHDGVFTFAYTIMPEFWQSPGDMTCGVYVHEFGHMVFDLPDLYDYDYSSEGVGNWSLMAGGSWNGPSGMGASPALPDAWSRIQMGYATPLTLTQNTIGVQIQSVQTSSTVYKLWKNGAPLNEYFLVENRQQNGYDTYLPGNGLLIYHVDNSVSSNDNEWYPGHTSYGHYHVALEQADGLYSLEKNQNGGSSGDPYPGTSDKRTFAFSTVPDSKDYLSATTYVEILTISNSSGTMTADMNVSSDTPPLPPNNLTATVGDAQITLKWNKNTEADVAKYRIYRGTSSPATTLIDSTNSILDTTKLITGLTNGTKYYFRVKAVDIAGFESGFSNEVGATPIYIESILRLAPYAESGQYLNEQIAADTIANGKPSNRVYVLQRGGIYRANTEIQNYLWTLRIRANDSTTSQKPKIFLCPAPITGILPSQFINATGDVELINLAISGYYEPIDTSLRSLERNLILIPATTSGWKISADSCVLSNVTFAHIRTEGAASVVKVTNTVFANMGYLGNHNIGAGRAVDLRNQSIDSLILVNNTFVNLQDRIIRHYNILAPSSPMGFLLFDHNTIVNGMSYYGLFALGNTGSKVIITNNLLIDPFSLGNDTSFDRQIEFTSSGEKDPYGNNRMTWIYSEANDATQWTISSNYYSISDSGQAFYDQYASEGVIGEGSPLTWYINSKLGADSVNAFKKITISPTTVPSLMTKLMRWYRSPSGGNKTRNTPAAWVYGDPNVHPYADPYDYDRKGYQWLQDSLNCSYCSSEIPISTDGKVVGDTRWLCGWCTGNSMNITMAAGWNLISVSLLQSNYNADVVFPGKYGVMFDYDQVLADYAEAPILELGRGYWVYYTNATIVPISGAVANSIITACKQGWNLIGSRETEVQVANLQLSTGSIYGSVFRYDPGVGDYVETAVISPGQGIWIYVTEDCDLTIP